MTRPSEDMASEDMAGSNAPEFTVSEISLALKRVVEGEFSHVRIRGELGRVTRPSSGHVYLDLKDDRAVLNGVIWKGTLRKLTIQPEEGLEVVVTGRLTTYPGASRYQVVIESMAPAGAGALMAMLEKRKAQLRAEGLFDEARKRKPPRLPRVVGVVTSPSGAVIRDILHRLRDRFPIRVLIWPVAVQGEKCAPEVARAIRGFNALPEGGPIPRPDALIVARGGGSIEDLWGFNEEIVVRAAAESAIPLISAVGHETDTTLIDHAADIRAPTPTAAAEMLVPVRRELVTDIATLGGRLVRAMEAQLDRRRQRLRDLSRLLPDADSLFASPRHRLDMADRGLGHGIKQRVARARTALAPLAGRMTVHSLQLAILRKRERFEGSAVRLMQAIGRIVGRAQERENERARRLRPELLTRRLREARRARAQIAGRLARQGTEHIRQLRERLEALDRMRQSLGWRETLARGYAVVHGPDGLVTRREDALPLPRMEIEFHDGRLPVLPEGEGSSAAPASLAPASPAARSSRKARARSKTDTPPEEGQGSLF